MELIDPIFILLLSRLNIQNSVEFDQIAKDVNSFHEKRLQGHPQNRYNKLSIKFKLTNIINFTQNM